MKNKKEEIYFHESIRSVLINNKKANSPENTYLLLSIDSRNIYWLVKLDNETLSDEFLQLLKFILPLGVKIIGLLHLGLIEDNLFDTKTFSSYNLLKNVGNKIGREFIVDYYYSFIANIKTNSFSEDEGDWSFDFKGKVYKWISNVNKLVYEKEIKSSDSNILFKDLKDIVDSKFLIVDVFVNPLVIVNSQNFLMNEVYANKLGINFPELNIMIPNLTELIEDKNMEDEKIGINEHNSKKLENFFKSLDVDSNKITCSFLVNTQIGEETYFEETNNMFYSIFQEKSTEQIIKSIKISFQAIFPVTGKDKSNTSIIDISFAIHNHLKFLLNELHDLNMKKTHTYSLYTLNDHQSVNFEISQKSSSNFSTISNHIPVPLGILYSSQDIFDETEENLLSQRIYFHKILNLSDEFPKVRKFQLENKINDMLFSQCLNEIAKTNTAGSKHLFKRLKTVHSKCCSNRPNENTSSSLITIEGDYFYFHTNMDKFNDKHWGNGYRALQTMLSWFLLNGYSNFEIPNLEDIQKILICLGQKNLSIFSKNKIINLSDIGMSFSYIVDSELEIIAFRNRKEFEENLEDLKDCVTHYKSPLLISVSSDLLGIYTVLGINIINEDLSASQLLILNHNYSGNSSPFNIIKSGVCKWLKLTDFLTPKDSIEVMVFKTQSCI